MGLYSKGIPQLSAQVCPGPEYLRECVRCEHIYFEHMLVFFVLITSKMFGDCSVTRHSTLAHAPADRGWLKEEMFIDSRDVRAYIRTQR